MIRFLRWQARDGTARRRRLAGLVSGVAAAALACNVLLGSFLTVVAPGEVLALREVITVGGATGRDSTGSFLITTVSTGRANILSPLIALLAPDVDIVPTREEIPRGIDMRRYLKIMELMMEESQMVARVVALRRAGYDARLQSVVKVEEVLPGSPSSGLLHPGDIIESIDGVTVSTAQEVVTRVQARKPGEPVTVGFVRQGSRGSVSIRTVKLKDETAHAAIAVLVAPHPTYSAPMPVSIRVGDIKGSSAGCMFCLEILDQLLAEDLTRGHTIAGTGTIDLEGKIGPIAGVRQKAAAARRAGADIFLVPGENLKEVPQAGGGMRVIAISTLDEALQALERLPSTHAGLPLGRRPAVRGASPFPQPGRKPAACGEPLSRFSSRGAPRVEHVA